MKKHSFTDEQLLNLINNTISTKTNHKPNEFTGGNIQITSTNNHQLIKYRVGLYFGYKGKHPIIKTIDIKEDLVSIWTNAILLKIKSLQSSNNGMCYSELNELMNTPCNDIDIDIVYNNIDIGVNVDTGDTPVPPLILKNLSEIDAEFIAEYLKSKILSFKPNAKPKISGWVADIEKAIRIDGRTKQQLINCIDWIYNTEKGNFWIPNIMSGNKLREKFDTLEIQSLNGKEANTQKMHNFIDQLCEAQGVS